MSSKKKEFKQTKSVGNKSAQSQGKKKRRRQQRAGLRQDVPKNPVVASVRSRRDRLRDPRVGASGLTEDLTLSTQINDIAIQSNMQQVSLECWCMGVMSFAFQKSLTASAQTNAQVYYAYRFMLESLASFASGNTPVGSKFPYILMAMGRALGPKSKVSNGSTFKYSFLTTLTSPDATRGIGFTPYGAQWSTGAIPNAPVFENGFPLIDMATPGGYTEEVGAIAFQQMCTILDEKLKGSNPFRMVALNAKTSLDDDVSAFAIPKDVQGFGSNSTNSGGFGFTAKLEVPIVRPLLSSFNTYVVAASETNRYGNYNINTAGDPTFVGSVMCREMPEAFWRSKIPPRFHAVDFLELLDVVCQWVVAMIQQYVRDNPSVTDITPQLCPLTIQEVGLILRSVCMQAFKETQTAVQGVGPILPTSSNDNQFLPFVAGNNCCYLAPSLMSLPTPFIENIRALSVRAVRAGGSIEYYIPVLGKYFEDELVRGDYVVEIGDPPESVTVFKDPTTIFTKEIYDEKRKITVRVPMAETSISLVDGYGVAGLVAINDPTRLTELTTLWNEWLNESGLTNYTAGLGVMGSEKGLNALASSIMTRHWVTAEDSKDRQERHQNDSRLVTRSKKRLVSTVYSDRLAIADTSRVTIFTTAYEQVLSIWVLPSLYTTLNVPLGQSTLVPRAQSMMQEGYLAPSSSGNSGKALSVSHALYASKMIKGKLAAKTDWELFFEEMAKEGRGGILSGLVANLAGAAFPSLAGIAKGVADMIPI